MDFDKLKNTYIFFITGMNQNKTFATFKNAF